MKERIPSKLLVIDDKSPSLLSKLPLLWNYSWEETVLCRDSDAEGARVHEFSYWSSRYIRQVSSHHVSLL